MKFSYLATYVNSAIAVISALLTIVLLFSYLAERDKAKLRYVGIIFAVTIAVMVTFSMLEFLIAHVIYGTQRPM